MGEVYRARDPRLDRDVALKILPESLAKDGDRLARFEREAKVLASLNHSNIAQIYGLEETDPSAGSGQGSVKALVLELVEGPTLADRLTQGPISFDEVLPIATQIAEALEAAHEHGIIHRDLKPANIKVREDGTVKVLDFGLAKALEAPVPDSDLANSPTITSPATHAGVILGTAAYMSPEQARGKRVDKRTDIWAFGCVLYELLTGRQAFAGDGVSDLVVAVLTKEPDWASLSAATPPRITDLVRRCLRKDPRQRLHDIADARLEIEEAIAQGPSGSSVNRSERSPGQRGRAATGKKLAWAGFGAALGALVASGLMLSGVWPRARPPDTRPLRLSIVHPEGGDVSAPAISPDGRRVAYAARRLDGMPLLWVRDLASGEVRSLAGTEGASVPFWSPDSQDLAFGTEAALKRVPADGGPVQVVTERTALRGGSWGADGTIVFGDSELLPLFRVSASGGTATPLTTLQSADWSHYWPSFLPDGRRFLFTAKLWTRAAEASEQGIYLGALDSPEVRRILPDLSSAVYAPPGVIVFVRNGELMAAPFDLAAGSVTAPPTSIGGTVAVDDAHYFSGISAAADGTIAMRPPPAVALAGPIGSAAFNADLHLVDRSGTGGRVFPAERFSYTMALHPDGHRLAASIVDPRTRTQDLWLIDLQSGDKTPLTTTRGFAGLPVWSHDGTRIAYAYQPPGQQDDVYITELRTGQTTPVIETSNFEDPIGWSHDGEHLAVYIYAESNLEKAVLSAWSFRTGKLTRVAGSPAYYRACFSPDDRYLAFTSEVSGRTEVLVTTFPDPRQTWPLTTEGGHLLSWRADGSEILVATLSGHIVAYPVSTEDGFSAGGPTTLVRDVGIGARYSAATADHSKILIRVSPDAANDKGEIRLLFGWADSWRQRQLIRQP